MVKKSLEPRESSNPFLVLELALLRRGRDSSIVMYASRAGTDDVGAHEWPLAFGILSESQALDVVAKFTDTAAVALLTYLGVKQDLIR